MLKLVAQRLGNDRRSSVAPRRGRNRTMPPAKQAEPRFCVVCGVNRRAKPGSQRCYGCMPGGPFHPPPVLALRLDRGLLRLRALRPLPSARLHPSRQLPGLPGVGRNPPTKWLCVGCANWRRLHPRVEACTSCSRPVAVNERSICRLCWKNARGHRLSARRVRSSAPTATANSFFARMQLAAALRRHGRARRAAPPWPPGRPVAHRQLVLFAMPHDLSRGRGALPEPRDAELAAALEWTVTEHARVAGWSGGMATNVRCGIRTVLGLQDTPRAPIRYSGMLVLAAADHHHPAHHRSPRTARACSKTTGHRRSPK